MPPRKPPAIPRPIEMPPLADEQRRPKLPELAVLAALQQKAARATGGATPAARPRVVTPGARNMLSRLTGAILETVGDEEDGGATFHGAGGKRGQRLTAEMLRVLDAGPEHSLFAQLPRWLREADTLAAAELAAWYPARGLPSPDGETDPGEPTSKDAAVITFPRPQPKTPQQQLVEFLKCRRDRVYFVDSYCFLENPGAGGLIPFRLWDWQAYLLHQWGRHSKNIALKARQIGVSEMAAAFSLHEVRFHDTRHALFISKGDKEAKHLKNRAEVMYLNLPPWLQAGAQALDSVEIGTSNTETLQFVFTGDGRRLTSSITSLPATANVGRSFTASTVVLDEWAHQMWSALIWGAIKPTIDNGGRIIGISTANGLGNLFHQQWDAAAKGKSSFFHIFLSWRRHPLRDDAWYAQEETEFTATNQAHLLHQEYPREPMEAFIQSGRPVFDQAYLIQHAQRLEEEKAARAQEGLPPWTTSDGLTIYEPPEPNHRYVLAADVAEGLEKGDFDAAVVIDRETLREVACLHGQWPVEVYARRLDALGRQYNDALLAPERNNHGHAILLALQSGLANPDPQTGKAGKPYPNLYHHTEPITPGRRQDARPGWPTNIATKPLVIDALARVLRELLYTPRTPAFLDECNYFVYDERGRSGAAESLHDDLVMATAIAVYIATRPDTIAQALAYVRELHDKVQGRVEVLQAQRGESQHGPGAPARRQIRPQTLTQPALPSPLPTAS